VLVLEKEAGLMQRASYNNQARVHNGYHYPRSVLTALRSRVNLPVFAKEYAAAVVSDFDKFYGVARSFSKVSARQFERFFERIGAEIESDDAAMALFNPGLIEAVFKVKEYGFDATKLKALVTAKLERLNVDVHTKESVQKIVKEKDGITVMTDKSSYRAKKVINATYSSINSVNRASGLKTIPLKHELTEMCLVELPPELQGKAFTIMCGPFFSIMPFPAKADLYTLSHVRYTPHSEWHDSDENFRNSHDYLDTVSRVSHFPAMHADVKRYLPAADNIKYSGESLWEVKTVLPQSEDDDSRPILYLAGYGGVKGYICIMGGKIDNIYDVFRELKETYEKA
jgi:glycine/D-amino acid oxidase-like deaminating enzyme